MLSLGFSFLLGRGVVDTRLSWFVLVWSIFVNAALCACVCVCVDLCRSGIFFVGIVEREVDALLVISLLHRVHNVLKTYLGVVSPGHIKMNFSTVYQVRTHRFALLHCGIGKMRCDWH